MSVVRMLMLVASFAVVGLLAPDARADGDAELAALIPGTSMSEQELEQYSGMGVTIDRVRANEVSTLRDSLAQRRLMMRRPEITTARRDGAAVHNVHRGLISSLNSIRLRSPRLLGGVIR